MVTLSQYTWHSFYVFPGALDIGETSQLERGSDDLSVESTQLGAALCVQEGAHVHLQ